MNAFYDRLRSVVQTEGAGEATVSEASEEPAGGVSTRGGDLVQIIASASGLIAALSPIVIAWIRGRGLEVEEKLKREPMGRSSALCE